MNESNDNFGLDMKENHPLLSSKPIVNKSEDCFSPKINTPLLRINENYVTPLRNRDTMKLSTPGTPLLNTPNQNPMIITPNGTKLIHPFILNIIRNMGNYTMSPNMFTVKEKSVRDDSILSPDLSGSLFPADIDTESDTQYYFDAALFKKYEKNLLKKSDKFFKEENILPSPEIHDSGLGASLQTSTTSFSTSRTSPIGPRFLLSHKTPPSEYKWNREEYRSNAPSSPIMDFSYESEDDDVAPLESTQIFDDGDGLACNMSMRNHSIIRSPMCDDDDNDDDDEFKMSFVDGECSFDGMRTSPSAIYSSKVFDDLGLSPIKSQSQIDSDYEDFM